MAMASALVSLGAAFQDEVQREVGALRQEVEHERRFRQMLEEQVSTLQQAVYSNVEVDALLLKIQKQQEERAAALQADCERRLSAAQRELEYRIESVVQSCQEQGTREEPEGQKRSAEDVPLLTAEIDRKLGTMLMDFDQKLNVARSHSQAVAEEASQRAVQRADQAQVELRERLDAIEASSAGMKESLSQAFEAQHSLERQILQELEGVKSALKQEIGTVLLEVDQVRAEAKPK